MITGFNTDIEYEGVTYHVQTEDKGLETPLILSLVYDRGTILASKRSPYEDLLTDFDEKILAERLQKQHKLICAAIRAGRIEDLKRMTMRESSKKKGLIAQKEVKNRTSEKPPTVETTDSILSENILASPTVVEKENQNLRQNKEKQSSKKEEIPLPQILHLADERFTEIKQPESLPSAETDRLLETEIELEKLDAASLDTEEVWDMPISLSDQDLIIEEVEILEEVTILPAEAVEIITDFSRHEEIADDSLSVDLLNEVVFKAGHNKTISVCVTRGAAKKQIVGASVMAKVLGANFRPLIFHGKTDSNGVAVLQIHLPHFSRGRAAVLIKAISGNDEAEIRRIIQPG